MKGVWIEAGVVDSSVKISLLGQSYYARRRFGTLVVNRI